MTVSEIIDDMCVCLRVCVCASVNKRAEHFIERGLRGL